MTPSRLLSHRWIAAGVLMAVCVVPRLAPAAERPEIESQLQAGQLAEAEQALEKHLGQQPDDDLARFQLGTIKFLRGVERLSQDGARYGVLSRSMMLPFVRVGGFVAENRQPEPVTYDDVRSMIERFQASVKQAEATLAPIQDTQLTWKLDLQQVRLDLDGDGSASQLESLAALFTMVANRRQAAPAVESFPVRFDTADAYWLRGYCHVLMALADMTLAYDHQPLFEHTAHMFFAKPKTEFASRRQPVQPDLKRDSFFTDELLDVIAAVHLMKFKLREPARLAAAHQHLLQMVALSRQSWDSILAETDDDREWIPGPSQASVIPRLTMDAARIEAWRSFLDEAEAVLQGEKLIPFWRPGFTRGVNLNKAFTKPRDFDLVLWVQGTAALVYLEEGEFSRPETWGEFQRVFGGEFLGFAMWIN